MTCTDTVAKIGGRPSIIVDQDCVCVCAQVTRLECVQDEQHIRHVSGSTRGPRGASAGGGGVGPAAGHWTVFSGCL